MKDKLFWILVVLMLLGFGGYTAWIAIEYGYLSVFEAAFSSAPAFQIYFDLSVSLTLLMIWMVTDHRRRGQSLASVAPFVLLTLVLGAVGPLVYLTVRFWPRAQTQT